MKIFIAPLKQRKLNRPQRHYVNIGTKPDRKHFPLPKAASIGFQDALYALAVTHVFGDKNHGVKPSEDETSALKPFLPNNF